MMQDGLQSDPGGCQLTRQPERVSTTKVAVVAIGKNTAIRRELSMTVPGSRGALCGSASCLETFSSTRTLYFFDGKKNAGEGGSIQTINH